MNTVRVGLTSLVLVGVLVSSASADQTYQGQPPPQSADELITAFDNGLAGEETEETSLDEILSKSQLTLKLRNYYLNRSRPDNTDPIAWAQGGSVEYKVDKVAGYFGLTAEYFGSFKLDGTKSHDGTLLLEPGQDDITTFGVVNPRINLSGHTISLYRQKFDLPYVNAQDNRVVPNTFEGYVVGLPKAENDKFQYIVGYISEMKRRNDETFNSMAEVVGVDGKDRGMVLGGLRYFITPDLSLGGVNYFVDDVLNISYGELVHKRKFDQDLANTLSLQYSDQRSVGDDLVRDESFSTFFWGAQNALSYRHATLKTAFTFNDTGGDLRSPYGSYPGYNSSIVEDFNRAGEKSWQVGLGYNFARIGLPGMGLTAAHVHGFDAINEVSKESLADKYETDVTLDYRLTEGILKGFWVRLRGAYVNEDGKGTTQDYRAIVNYEIPLYKPDSPASNS